MLAMISCQQKVENGKAMMKTKADIEHFTSCSNKTRRATCQFLEADTISLWSRRTVWELSSSVRVAEFLHRPHRRLKTLEHLPLHPPAADPLVITHRNGETSAKFECFFVLSKISK